VETERPRVICAVCGEDFCSLSSLRSHQYSVHPELSVRERSVMKQVARREAGWWGVGH
jgi:hypothetical protein